MVFAMVKLSRASRSGLKRTLQRSCERLSNAIRRPSDIVRSFVRKKISHEMSAAPRNDATLVLRVLLEGIVLERIDLIANKISDPHLCSPVGGGRHRRST